jgi:hypothetical protein
MFKPLIPVISDVYSHVFSEAIHLATVHARYGSNHLAKDLANNSEGNGATQKNLNPDESSLVHVNITENIYNFCIDEAIIGYSSFQTICLPEIYLLRFVPPPDHEC